MNGEKLPSATDQDSGQSNPWSILENYSWHDAVQKENEPEQVERMVSPLPVINWDEFCAATDEAKHAFVDAVRDDFGPVGYIGFFTLFNSRRYWLQKWMHEPIKAQLAGDHEKNEELRRQRPFVESGKQPSMDEVKETLKSLDYQWNSVKLSPKQRERFNTWYKQCYRVRAGEKIAPFGDSKTENAD